MRKSGLWGGWALLGLSIALWTLQLFAARRNSCVRYGGAPDGSALEAGPLTASLSWWPIGQVCTWRRADGLGVLESFVGSYAWSVAAYAVVGLAVAAFVVGILIGRRATGGAEIQRMPEGSWRSIGPRR